MAIRRLLIANRGEIALRIIRTCERLGIQPVAIHTAADAGAPHTFTDGEEQEVPSYLDVDAVVAAAVAAGADAVHPGYGFLSENARFARAVREAGLVFVGPTPEVIEQMGRKDAARDLAVAAGVPVVPTGEEAAYPVLVKAAAGGGGKGMRVVRSDEEMADAVAAAQREALAAFGDDTMLVEKYVERGRHVEVQVLGDAHGTVVHLGERDCSAQRRHQKVLEEAPAPTLDETTRRGLHAAAVDLARHVGYTNAGTVEFLLDEATGDYYFLEMNTRLQVEHPVTELVWGVDLVELQLRVAAGEPLGLTQADLAPTGHAIEARVYAEDAFGGFLPQAGTATEVIWPDGDLGSTVRVDHALESGQVVSTGFDPMLAKVVAHAPDRASAVDALVGALDRTAIFGLTTNVGFLRVLADSEPFREATLDTAWLDRESLPAPDDEHARALSGVVLADELEASAPGPWQPDRFRLGGPRGPLVEDGRDVTPLGWFASTPLRDDGPRRGTTSRVGALRAGEGFVRRGPDGTEVVLHGHRFALDRPDPFRAEGGAAGDGVLTAPMPGTVLDVRVSVGQEVTEGQVLAVLEAMKMELSLRAPFDGTVDDAPASVGAQVALGTPLLTVTPDSPAAAPEAD